VLSTSIAIYQSISKGTERRSHDISIVFLNPFKTWAIFGPLWIYANSDKLRLQERRKH